MIVENHQTIVELIPWYVNGTLNEVETDRVSAHLAGCATCRAQIDAELELARQIGDPPEGLDRLEAAEQRSFEALAGRIRDSERRNSP